MKVLKMAACAAVIATSASANTIDLSDYFSSFVALGDSLTDDGKFAGTPFENGPPSDGGRFSNGITFAEHIAQDFGFSANLAIGGATAGSMNENPLPPGFGTFGGQVASLAGLAAGPIGIALGDRPLFSVLFGSNDILQNIGLPDASVPGLGNIIPNIGKMAADAVEANIRAIKSIDAGFNNFVVMNLPNIAQTPLFANPAFGVDPFLAGLAALETNGFNDQLALNIAALRNDGVNIIEFDLEALFAVLTADAVLNGIDIDNPCTFSLGNQDPALTCAFSLGSPDDTDITLADSFFFVDGIHPNRDVHAAAADAFRTTVAASVAPVPLPAGLPLLIAGLGAFGVLRMRRAA